MLADDDADWLLASDAPSPTDGASEATPEKEVRPTVGFDRATEMTIRHFSMDGTGATRSAYTINPSTPSTYGLYIAPLLGAPNPLPIDPSWVVPPGEQPKRLAIISAVVTGAQFELRTETGFFERRIVLPANHRRLFRFNLRVLWPDQVVREHVLAWNPLTDNTQSITIQVNGAWAPYPLATENLRVLVDIQELNRAILVHKLTQTDLEVLGRTAESFDQGIIPPSAESGGTRPLPGVELFPRHVINGPLHQGNIF